MADQGAGSGAGSSAAGAGGQGVGEFYVGYLPMPRGLVRFARRLAPAAIVGCGLLAWMISRAQRDPGAAVWHDTQARTFVGWVEAQPYPHIRIPAETGQAASETLMLVEVGKFGGGQRAAPLSGRVGRISGWMLERDGRRMIEMEPGVALSEEASLPAAQVERLKAVRSEPLGAVLLRGEIIDSKCYLGAMKPGEGKAHKACATLCVRGGIPPMLVAADGRGGRLYYLLCGADGAALDERLLPFVGDRVEVRGELERRGDLLLFRIDPGRIQRL